MPFFFSHAFISSRFTSTCFPFLLRLTWLADPALATSVYPNRMQYTPRVLQEASLLDGVDAGVRGNGRRFGKTSSCPPCRCYAFTFFYPYFLTTSSSLCSGSFIRSHNPLHPALHYKPFPHPLSPLFLCHFIDLLQLGMFPIYGRTM